MHTQAKRSWRRLVTKLAIVDRLRATKLKLVEAKEGIERLKRNVQTSDISTSAVVEHLNSVADSERQLKDELKRVDAALADVGGDDTSGDAKPVAARTRSRRGNYSMLFNLTISRSRCAARSGRSPPGCATGPRRASSP